MSFSCTCYRRLDAPRYSESFKLLLSAPLVEDEAGPFRDPAMRAPLEKEVAAHDTQAEAYRLDKHQTTHGVQPIVTSGQCQVACRRHVFKTANDKLDKMKEEMTRRENARDDKDYRDAARKRAKAKEKP